MPAGIFMDMALWQKPPNLDQRLRQNGNEKVEIHERKTMTTKPPGTMSRTLNLWQSYHFLQPSHSHQCSRSFNRPGFILSLTWWRRLADGMTRKPEDSLSSPERQSGRQNARNGRSDCTFCTMKTWRKWRWLKFKDIMLHNCNILH